MHLIFQTILLATCFMLVNCNKPKSDIIEERERAEAYAEIEALRIAEERARFSDMAAEKRGIIVEDLAERESTRLAEREMNMELAATEKVRRERVAAEIKYCVDRINIRLRSKTIAFKQQLFINEREAEDDMIIVSPAGYTIKYKGTEGDYYIFEYNDGLIEVIAKRTRSGLSFATVSHLKDLADGFPALGAGSPVVAPIDFDNINTRGFPQRGSRLYIMKATYGANDTHKDVTSIVKGKVNNGRLDFSAHSGELGGDPCWGHHKTFRIKYMSRGRIYEKSFSEGRRVNLP